MQQSFTARTAAIFGSLGAEGPAWSVSGAAIFEKGRAISESEGEDDEDEDDEERAEVFLIEGFCLFSSKCFLSDS